MFEINYFILSVTTIYTCLFYFYDVLGPYYSKSYKNLSREDKLEWNVRINSTVNSTIASIVTYKTLFYDEIPLIYKTDPFLGTTGEPMYLFQAIFAYFIYDTLLMFLYPKPLYTKLMFIHHLIGLFNLYFSYKYGLFHYHIWVSLIIELSTPFVNIRWFLYTTKRTESLFYLINGLLLTVSFISLRAFIYTIWIIYDLSTNWDKVCLAIPNVFFRCLWISPFLILQPLNFYWSSLIAHGLFKLIRAKYSGKEKEKKEKAIHQAETEELIMEELKEIKEELREIKELQEHNMMQGEQYYIDQASQREKERSCMNIQLSKPAMTNLRTKKVQ